MRGMLKCLDVWDFLCHASESQVVGWGDGEGRRSMKQGVHSVHTVGAPVQLLSKILSAFHV